MQWRQTASWKCAGEGDTGTVITVVPVSGAGRIAPREACQRIRQPSPSRCPLLYTSRTAPAPYSAPTLDGLSDGADGVGSKAWRLKPTWEKCCEIRCGIRVELGGLKCRSPRLHVSSARRDHSSTLALHSSTRHALNFISYCFVVRPEGLEPPTLGSEVRCSIQLSYGRTCLFQTLQRRPCQGRGDGHSLILT
jgi:hypothetical protein